MKFLSSQYSSLGAGLVSLLLAAETAMAVPAAQFRSGVRTAPARPPNRGMFTWLGNTESTKEPILNHDFPDPSIIKGADAWYAVATASGSVRVQVAKASDPSGPWALLSQDLFTNAGAWTNGKDIWAPDIREVDNGTYVMYYTAQLSNSTRHCLGVATANAILGPWTTNDEPWHCDYDLGGTIDSSGFQDETDGSRWVVYKVDGNSIGNGGSCDNTVAPIKSTPLMLQKVAGDGITKIGAATQILDRTDDDGPLVEAPNIIRSSAGKYILFFSSHCFTSSDYNVKYATATSVTGPYTRGGEALLETNDFNLTSPGGGTSVIEGGLMVFHANCNAGGSNRCMYVSNFTETGTNVLANRGRLF